VRGRDVPTVASRDKDLNPLERTFVVAERKGDLKRMGMPGPAPCSVEKPDSKNAIEGVIAEREEDLFQCDPF